MACGARLDCGFLLPCGHYEKIVNRLLEGYLMHENLTQLGRADPAAWPVAPGWQPQVDGFFASPRGQALLDFLQQRLQAGLIVYLGWLHGDSFSAGRAWNLSRFLRAAVVSKRSTLHFG